MAKIQNPTKVITGVNTRWSYANVWDAKSINGGAPKYSVSLIIPKSDTVTVNKIKAAIEAAYEEGQSKLKGNGKIDQFMDEATSEDSKGFEPASPENLEETVMLRMIIQDLLKKIHEINPKHGRILDLICEDYTKGQILDELGLGKSQGYADIKAAQALAKKLYFGE